MTKKIMSYEIIDHGVEHSQYFQGCGTAFTNYDIAVTGSGKNAKEAYNDAVEQLYTMDIDTNSLDKILPTRPKGINAKDRVPAKYFKDDYNEIWYYVSIRVKFKE